MEAGRGSGNFPGPWKTDATVWGDYMRIKTTTDLELFGTWFKGMMAGSIVTSLLFLIDWLVNMAVR